MGSTALAATQFGYPYSYYPYVGYQYHQPLYYQQPMAYPMPAGQAQTRTILSLGNALELKGTFVTAAAGTHPARTISGDFLIQQNGLLDLSTSMEAKMKVYLRSSTDINGKALMVRLGNGATCEDAINAIGVADANPAVDAAVTNAPVLARASAPIFTINGFYITSPTKDHNIDGSNSKMSLKPITDKNWLLIQDGVIPTGATVGTPGNANIIGCSSEITM